VPLHIPRFAACSLLTDMGKQRSIPARLAVALSERDERERR